MSHVEVIKQQQQHKQQQQRHKRNHTDNINYVKDTGVQISKSTAIIKATTTESVQEPSNICAGFESLQVTCVCMYVRSSREVRIGATVVKIKN